MPWLPALKDDGLDLLLRQSPTDAETTDPCTYDNDFHLILVL